MSDAGRLQPCFLCGWQNAVSVLMNGQQAELDHRGRSCGERHYWRDLWHYRELFYVLAWRDVAVRYKQTVIGVGLGFDPAVADHGRVHGDLWQDRRSLPTEGTTPYALMVFAGLLPWQLFSTSLTGASNSLVGNANLLSKVYFPAPHCACIRRGRCFRRLS